MNLREEKEKRLELFLMVMDGRVLYVYRYVKQRGYIFGKKKDARTIFEKCDVSGVCVCVVGRGCIYALRKYSVGEFIMEVI